MFKNAIPFQHVQHHEHSWQKKICRYAVTLATVWHLRQKNDLQIILIAVLKSMIPSV